jgi:uncharacterized protein YbjT (DUF2867 family)
VSEQGPLLVTGATGELGSAVVADLQRRGVAFRGISRKKLEEPYWCQANLVTGDGLREALQGVSAIVHCASDWKQPGDDLIAIKHLVAEARTQNLRLVFVSIAGIETAAKVSEYYGVKLMSERIVASACHDYAIVRATQFYSFLSSLIGRLTFKLATLVPVGITLRPASTEFVAEKIVDVALSTFVGRSPDVCGPEKLTLLEMVKKRDRFRGRHAPLIPIPAVIRPFSGFAKIGPVNGTSGGPTWDRWLQEGLTKHNRYD